MLYTYTKLSQRANINIRPNFITNAVFRNEETTIQESEVTALIWNCVLECGPVYIPFNSGLFVPMLSLSRMLLSPTALVKGRVNEIYYIDVLLWRQPILATGDGVIFSYMVCVQSSVGNW